MEGNGCPIATATIHVLQGAAGPPPFIPCSQGLHCHISVPVTVPCTARGAQPSPAMLCVPWGATQSPCMAQGATQPPHQCSAQLTVQYNTPPFPPILKMQCPAQLVCNATPPPTLQRPAQLVCNATPPSILCTAPGAMQHPLNTAMSHTAPGTVQPPQIHNLHSWYSMQLSLHHQCSTLLGAIQPPPRHHRAPGRHNPCSNALSPPFCISPSPRAVPGGPCPPPHPSCHVLPRSPAMCTPVSSRVKAAASQLQWLERTAPEHIWFNASAWRLA